jgi:hypothetical protein
MARNRIQKTTKDNLENLTQNIKQIKLNDYWLNQPSPLNKNRFDALSEEEKEEEGVDKKKHLQSTTNICGTSPK